MRHPPIWLIVYAVIATILAAVGPLLIIPLSVWTGVFVAVQYYRNKRKQKKAQNKTILGP